jgi:hypothetical protein
MEKQISGARLHTWRDTEDGGSHDSVPGVIARHNDKQ